MARTNRLAALRKAIAALGAEKHRRRYDDRLAKEILAHARGRQVAGAAQSVIAKELGISQPTLSKILRRESKLIPVKVVADSKKRSSRSSREFLVRGPGGVVVEGLSLEEVAVLFSRIASCSG
jgi:hypothetical protein